jgi:hypothetical protein
LTLWSPRREDVAPALWIVLLPLLVALPQLAGWLLSDPTVYAGGMTRDWVHGIVGGFPKIDPNSAYTTQALGYRAALDWLQGEVPWWNPYSGVGLPLAAEYQPAAFFPLTLLLLLPKGMLWQHLLLQVLSGLGTYALLRQMGLTRLAATTGGALFAFNGTLAWFSHAPAQPVAFLPWMLLGIERARAKATLDVRGGWRLLAAAMGLSLLAGFPETAYIDGLLALAWAALRGFETPAPRRAAYAARIALGGVAGIAIAAPQILAFFQFLPHAFLGGHAEFSHAALPPFAVIPSLIAPYAYGPIFGYPALWPAAGIVWGSIGGYVSIIVLIAAIYGVVARRSALGALLLAWCVLALAKTFGIEPALTLWNLVPGIPMTAFLRYAQPSWELALIILAAWGLDDLQRSRQAPRAAWRAATLVAIIALGGALVYGIRLWPELRPHVGLRNPLLASAAWALVTAAVFLTLLRRGKVRELALLLVFDAAFLFAVPTLSSPRGGSVDMPAIAFLRENLGLQRFHTLGPIAPNYGAYFGIASINHNYLPVSARWADWVKTRLDRGISDGVVFNGVRAPGHPDPAHELRANLDAYQWVGVKYVVAPGNDDPFVDAGGAQPRNAGVKKAYSDTVMSIYELPDPRPYFEVIAGACSVRARDRTHATVSCDAPARLVRRELFFPGWSATVNGAPAPLAEHEGLFQRIELPKGSSEVRFAYAPADIGWAWLASLCALVALAVPPLWRAIARNAMKGTKARAIGTTGNR